REWQMYRTFQTALTLQNPHVVAFLGDVFDEGQWSSDKQFDTYMERFWELFYIPRGTKMLVVAGNHDIGFHYRMHKSFVDRFDKTFNTSAVHMKTFKGNTFVLINSMAMHMDNCNLCVHAEAQLKDVERRLQLLPSVLQHFPLYRTSDSECSEPDAAPSPDRNEVFREKWDCLSEKATEMAMLFSHWQVLSALQPRAVFTGHTHHGCLTYHRGDIPEWTLPSISWRNKKSPSFTLVRLAGYSYLTAHVFGTQFISLLSAYGGQMK
ncbi:cell division control protein/DNA repair exonuclease, putative, partial [Ixodes scapularis]